MKAIAALLLKTLAKRYYAINAGFFLFIFFMFFGIVYGGQLIAYHQSLILGMLQSPTFMGAVWLAWLLYILKCILFNTAEIEGGDSAYILSLKAVPPLEQFAVYILVSIAEYLPVLVYSLFVIIMAYNRMMWVTAWLVTGYQLLMILFCATRLYVSINFNDRGKFLAPLVIWIARWNRFRLGYRWFLAGHLLYTRKAAFLIVKMFSILLLSVSLVRNGDHFDEDLLSIFFELIFAGHAILVFYCVDFNEGQLRFSRNLPLDWLNVAWSYVFTYTLLLVPDLLFMLINNHGNLPLATIFMLYGTAVAVLFLYTAILYGCGLNMEHFMLLVFVSFLVIFFLQKTDLPLLTMLGVLLTATVIFKTSYYTFERE